MLNIKNLEATIDNKHILKGLNLNIKPGEVHAIMGPNGSGKSTIAHTLAGKPNYLVEAGNVDFKNEDLIAKDPYERSLLGLFLAFQLHSLWQPCRWTFLCRVPRSQLIRLWLLCRIRWHKHSSARWRRLSN